MKILKMTTIHSAGMFAVNDQVHSTGPTRDGGSAEVPLLSVRDKTDLLQELQLQVRTVLAARLKTVAGVAGATDQPGKPRLAVVRSGKTA
jgi:hypothetical protein